MKPRVLIIDKMHPSILSELRKIGLEPDYQPSIKRKELLNCLADYIGLIVRSKTQIDEEVIAQAKNLQFIGRAGSGLDVIDVAAAKAAQVEIFNAPEGNRDAVAEHTLGLILALLHNITKGNQEVKQGLWQREANRGLELKNKTLSIIGYGNVGRELAKRAAAFGCKVLVYDRFHSGFAEEYIEESSMEKIFTQTDILSLHVPLNESSRYLVDEAYLAKFRKNIFLINTSRGEVVKLNALRKAIEQGKVLGASLDVLENEKIAKLSEAQKKDFAFLQQANNVILTPHVAGWTQESYERINQVLIQKIQQILDQKILKNA